MKQNSPPIARIRQEHGRKVLTVPKHSNLESGSYVMLIPVFDFMNLEIKPSEAKDTQNVNTNYS